MANQEQPTITPEALLLGAILRTMKPKRRREVLNMIGDTQADNVLHLRAPFGAPHDQRIRNQLIREARAISGEG